MRVYSHSAVSAASGRLARTPAAGSTPARFPLPRRQLASAPGARDARQVLSAVKMNDRALEVHSPVADMGGLSDDVEHLVRIGVVPEVQPVSSEIERCLARAMVLRDVYVAAGADFSDLRVVA